MGVVWRDGGEGRMRRDGKTKAKRKREGEGGGVSASASVSVGECKGDDGIGKGG